MKILKIKQLGKHTTLPVRSTQGSVGYDLFAQLENDIVIAPGEIFPVGCGFAMALENGFGAFIYARSGLGTKKGVIPANCVGVIDSDYRGEVIVCLKNSSTKDFVIHPGDRIAQMVIAKCSLPEIEVCESLDETDRGTKGFGSSGI